MKKLDVYLQEIKRQKISVDDLQHAAEILAATPQLPAELHHPQPEEQPSTRHFLLSCTLEWNPGGHFQHPEERTAQGFAWSMK